MTKTMTRARDETLTMGHEPEWGSPMVTGLAFVIARRRCLDALRSQYRTPLTRDFLDIAGLEGLPDTAWAEPLEGLIELDALLSGCHPRDSYNVSLALRRLLHRESYDEITLSSGLPRGAARVRVHRGYRTLRARLQRRQ